VLALALFTGLLGCAGQTQSSKAESAVSEESSAVSATSSEIVSSKIISSQATSTVEYIPLDRFEDANIINTVYTRKYLAENELTASVDSKSDPARNWTVLFVTQNYKAFSPKYIYSDSLSGSWPKSSIFVGNETSFVLQAFRINFETTGVPDGLTPEENGSYTINLQVVMKENADHSLTLLGFVTNQTMDIKCPSDLAEFLKVLPEYENLEVAVPKPDAPLEAINLTDITGGLHILDVWPVGDALYVFGFDPDYRLVDGKFTTIYLKAYSLETLTLLYEESFPFTHTNNIDCLIENEGLIFTADKTNGQPYYRVTASGVTEIEFIPPEENSDKLYRLSDTATIRESGIDLLLEKDGKTVPILSGVPNDGYDGNIHELSRYRFRYRIDDTSFVYSKIGWEWVIESGIYNIETGKTTVLKHENADVLVPVAVQNGKIILTAYYDSLYTSFGPHVYDISSEQITDLDWFDETFHNYYTKFLGVDNSVAAFAKTDTGLCVLLFDLSEETTPRRFDTSNYNLKCQNA